MKKEKIATVVVTYNRKDLLKKCVESLKNQTRFIDKIIIIDNASTDGTKDYLDSLKCSSLYLISCLEENIGGAGGFYEGMKISYREKYDWTWVMDDDALPQLNCLENLIRVAEKNLKIATYAPLVVDESNSLSWNISAIEENGKSRTFSAVSDIKMESEKIKTNGSGLLGAIYHYDTLKKVGFPNKDLFIRGDEIDFNIRVQKAGFSSFLIPNAILQHPAEIKKTIAFLKWKYSIEEKPLWKTFYYVRNQVYINKKYRNIFIAIFKGLILSFLEIVLYKKNRNLNSIKIIIKAFFFGIMGKIGKKDFSYFS